MIKTITAVIEYDTDDFGEIECDDDLQEILNHIYDPLMVTDFVMGDAVDQKPVHYSDRELAERGLPLYAWAFEPSTGRAIRLERGMLGFFYHQGPETAFQMNEAHGVSPAQVSAMRNGSMFGWHTPASHPENPINQED